MTKSLFQRRMTQQTRIRRRFILLDGSVKKCIEVSIVNVNSQGLVSGWNWYGRGPEGNEPYFSGVEALV